MVHPTPTKVLLTTTFEPLERLRRNALAPSALVPSAGGSGKLKMILKTAAERSAAMMHQVRWWHLGQRAMGGVCGSTRGSTPRGII